MADNIVIKTTLQGTKQVSAGLSGMGASLVALNQGFQLATVAGNALIAPFKAIVKEGLSFQQQMANVAAISKTTAKEFKALSDEAKRIGSTTAFSATEAAKGMEELKRAGLSTAQTLKVTQQAMSLSSATGLILSESAKTVALSLKIFDKEGLTAKKTVDLLTQTTGASATSITGLQTALLTSAGTANASGIKFKDLTVILGLMANAGVTGEKAGTALNGALSRLLNPTTEVKKALSDLELTVDDVNPKTNKFTDILNKLKEAGAEVDDVLKIFGQEAGPKFIKVIEGGTLAVDKMELAQSKANDAQAAADIRLKTLNGKTEILKSSMSALATTLFEKTAPALTAVVGGLGSMFSAINKILTTVDPMNEAYKKQTAGQDKAIESMNNYTDSGGEMTLELKDFLKVQGFAKIETDSTTVSIEKQTKQIKAVKKSLSPALDAWKAYKKSMSDAKKPMEAGVKNFANWSDGLDDVAKSASDATAAMEKFHKLEAKANKVTGFAKPPKLGGLSKGQSTGGMLAEGLGSQIVGVGGAISGFKSGGVGGAVVGGFLDVMGKSVAGQKIMAKINESLLKIAEPFFEAFLPLIEAITPALVALAPIIKAIMSIFGPLFKALIPILELMTPAIEFLAFQIKVGVFLLKHWGKKFNREVWDPIWKFLKMWGAGFFTIFQTAWTSIWTPIKTFWTNLWGGISSFFTSFVSAIKNVFGGGGGSTTDKIKSATGISLERGGIIPQARTGMLVGRRHSNGGIPIEAETGEFIVNRKAASKIGLDSLNSLNNGQLPTNPVSIIMNINSIDPRGQKEELREVMEELFLSGRLNVGAAV